MTEMDREQKKKWHKVGVIAAEFVMVVSVIAIVVVTTLIALGWNVNQDGEVEQTGLLQLHTVPTGATVTIDGEQMFAHTNMSRSLSPGSHQVRATLEGYDTWEKEIKIESGWLTRVYYPRLFWQGREPEQMAELGAELEFYSAAPNGKYALWAAADSTLWQWTDISGDKIKTTEVNVAEVLGLTDNTFNGEIVDISWSSNGEKVLTKIRNDDVISWYLVNLREIGKSQNLSANFGWDFADVQIMDDAADKLWTLENGNLRLVNMMSLESSRILVDGVESFSEADGALAYVRVKDEARWAGTYREGEQGAVDLYKLEAEPARAWLSKYYNEDYLTVVAGQKLTVYKGELPSYRADEKVKAKDYLAVFVEKDLESSPERLVAGESDEYVAIWNGAQVAVLDLDRGDLYNYEAGAEARWLDDSMMYKVADGALAVWDFDGTNRRELVASGVADYAAVITDNNRYLYYLQSGEEGLALTREQIIK